MSLSLAYEIARGGLMANATASSVVSRNIANVDNPNAGRKSVSTISSAIGVRLGTIGNAVSASLLQSVLANASKQGELDTIAKSLDRLSSVVNDPELGLSPAAQISELRAALDAAAAQPNDETLLRHVVSIATNVAGTLQDASRVVQQVRKDANADLNAATKQLNGLLSDFEQANSAIVAGTLVGRDVTDQIDRRNALLRDISSLVDVQATSRANNDMVLFAANGTTLFETVPRKIGFDYAPLTPGQPGGRLTIDGVPFSGAGSTQVGGKIGGLLQIRDDIAVNFGRQIDEMARGLITAFAETDQSAMPILPAVAGLFTYPGGPGLPPAGVVIDGLAMTISVNPNADPLQGGSVARIRDGGIGSPGDPGYVYNVSGGVGFSDRLREMSAMLAEAQAFDAGAGLGASASVLTFASTSAGWLESRRSDAHARLEDRQVLAERALSAWQGEIGVNLDEEMTSLMALERSYQATARLIATVDQMFASLLDATR